MADYIKYKLTIQDIVEAPGTYTYLLNIPESFTWEAGAHTHIAFIGYDAGDMPDKTRVRHLSISTLLGEGKIGITTRVPGSESAFKKELATLGIGQEVLLFKVGTRMALRRENRPVVLLSMGVGIATMRPVILSYMQQKDGVPSLTNVNVDASGHFIFRQLLDPLADDSYRNEWLLSRQDFYECLTKLITPATSIAPPIYYVVGSDHFLKEVIHLLTAAGVAKRDIMIDKKPEVALEFFSAAD